MRHGAVCGRSKRQTRMEIQHHVLEAQAQAQKSAATTAAVRPHLPTPCRCLVRPLLHARAHEAPQGQLSPVNPLQPIPPCRLSYSYFCLSAARAQHSLARSLNASQTERFDSLDRRCKHVATSSAVLQQDGAAQHSECGRTQAERCDSDEDGSEQSASAHLRIRLLDGSVLHQVGSLGPIGRPVALWHYSSSPSATKRRAHRRSLRRSAAPAWSSFPFSAWLGGSGGALCAAPPLLRLRCGGTRANSCCSGAAVRALCCVAHAVRLSTARALHNTVQQVAACVGSPCVAGVPAAHDDRADSRVRTRATAARHDIQPQQRAARVQLDCARACSGVQSPCLGADRTAARAVH
jgi:hypothetical protein